MADLIKLFDFRMQEGIKSDFKPHYAEKSMKKEKERNIQENNGNSFGKALENVSQAIQNKENSEKPRELAADKKSVEFNEKNGENEAPVQEIIEKLNLFLIQLQKLNPSDKKIEKIETLSKEPVSLENMMKSLTLFIQALGMNQNQSQVIQNPALKTENLNKESMALVQGIQKGLGQLKELMASDPAFGKDLTAAFQNGTIQLSKAGKDERKIFDLKIEKGASKNSDKKESLSSKDTSKTEALAQNMGEMIQAKEFKDKLQSEAQLGEVKSKTELKKENSEKKIKSGDTELTLNKKENANQVNFQQILKNEGVDKMGKVDNTKEIEKARKAELGKEIISQMGEKVSGFIGKNQSQILIQLKPEDLGNIKIMLEMKNDVIKGRIVVENNEVKEILQENINQVKSVLQDSGIQLGEMEVSTQQGNSQAFQRSFEEDKLQKTIAQNQKVLTLFSDLKAYDEGNNISFDYRNGGRIFLEA